MTELPEDPLSEAERRALQSLHQDLHPPRELEDQVILALKSRGLLRVHHAGRKWLLRGASALAASLMIFLSGVYLGPHLASPRPRPAGSQFVLFLMEGEAFRAPIPGMEQARVAEYRDWVHRLGDSGIRVSGEKLKDGEEILPAPHAGPLPGGPGQGSGVGSMGGYFIVEASNVDQARKIASTCPHLRYGGNLVIRQIDPV